MGKLISQRYEKFRFNGFHGAGVKIEIFGLEH